MFSKIGINNLMKQAQQIQERIKQIQEECAQLIVIGESGAGLVKVTMNGSHNCLHIELDPIILKDDIKILEELIVAAINDAVRRISEAQKEKMINVSSNI